MKVEEFYSIYYCGMYIPKDKYDKSTNFFSYNDMIDFTEAYHKNELLEQKL